MTRGDFYDQKRQLEQQFPGWHAWYVPTAMGQGTTWCAQPDPVVNADSPREPAERIRIAHMAPPDGAVPLASWRGYLARARKRREYDDAVARIWREKKPRPRRSPAAAGGHAAGRAIRRSLSRPA